MCIVSDILPSTDCLPRDDVLVKSSALSHHFTSMLADLNVARKNYSSQVVWNRWIYQNTSQIFEGFYTNLISFITHSQLSSFWLAISFIQPCQGPRWGHPGWIPWQRRVSRRGPCGPWAQCSCFPPGRDGLSLDVFGGSSLFFASHDLCDNYLCIYIYICIIYIYISYNIYIYK